MKNRDFQQRGRNYDKKSKENSSYRNIIPEINISCSRLKSKLGTAKENNS